MQPGARSFIAKRGISAHRCGPAKPARQSRLWNAGGPAGLAALEARNAKPNFATHAGSGPRNDQLGPGPPPRTWSISASMTNQRMGWRSFIDT
jgi:hypothetical protein